MANVVNVKVKYIRPKYDNLRDWTEDPNNVYIGRGKIVFIDGVRYPPKASIWANPFKKGSREVVCNQYREYLRGQIKNGDITEEDLLSLKGKNLGCWCKPEQCHGDIIVEFL